MIDALGWIFTSIVEALAGAFYVVSHLGTVFDFSDPVNLMRVIYYGASTELFFFVMTTVAVVWVVGIFRREFLWGVVGGMEWFANTVGRIFAWAGLLMVLQQIMVVFLQSIFRAADITIGPFGVDFNQTVGWYADGLKLYNAMVVCLCCAYTFAQGGHVRVDLVYATIGHRAKRVIDMLGSLFFMIPAMTLTWFYAWFFLWRHLITPKVNATDSLQALERKAIAFRWNVETIGFSPNGFNAYFLFKVLLVIFTFMVFMQAIAFFYRSWLEFVEGPESAGKNLDKDKLGDEDAELAAEIH